MFLLYRDYARYNITVQGTCAQGGSGMATSMTTLTFAGAKAPTHSDPRKGGEAYLGGLFRRCFGFLAREYRVRYGLRAMMALDDRILSDIGLTRTEVESAARFGRARTD